MTIPSDWTDLGKEMDPEVEEVNKQKLARPKLVLKTFITLDGQSKWPNALLLLCAHNPGSARRDGCFVEGCGVARSKGSRSQM